MTISSLSRAFVLITLFTVGDIDQLPAQSVTFDAFALPKPGFLTCLAISPPRDSAALGVVYTDESVEFDARESVAYFDSAGTALMLTVFASKQVGDSSYGEAYGIRFTKSDASTHVRAIAELPPGTKPTDPMPAPLSAKSEKLDLTSDELKRARALAVWIWEHRCRTTPREM